MSLDSRLLLLHLLLCNKKNRMEIEYERRIKWRNGMNESHDPVKTTFWWLRDVVYVDTNF